jgi:hypothetical protein
VPADQSKTARLSYKAITAKMFWTKSESKVTMPKSLEADTWILHESEALIGKASKGDVVVFYFEPLATQHMKVSGSPKG